MSSPSSNSPPPPPFGRGCRVGTIGSLARPRKAATAGAPASYDDYNWPRSSTIKGAIPEIALIGRSNVGKSTLLNALLYTSDILQSATTTTSSTDEDRRRRRPTSTFTLPRGGAKATMSPHPGETKVITWYQVREKYNGGGNAVRIVDLPGYGFAYTASDDRQRQTTAMMIQYLLHHQPLQRMLLLLDARHGLKQADIAFLQQLQEEQTRTSASSRFPALQLVLTKCDTVPQEEIARRVLQIRERLSLDVWQHRELSSLMHPTLFVAARERQGILAVQKSLAQVATRKGGGTTAVVPVSTQPTTPPQGSPRSSTRKDTIKTRIHRRATTTAGERNNHNGSTHSMHSDRNNKDQRFDRRSPRNGSYEPSNNRRPNNNQNTRRQAADTRYNKNKPADRRTSRSNSQDPYNRRTPSTSETTPPTVSRRRSKQNKTSIHRRATTTTGEPNNHNRSKSSARNNQDQPFDRRTNRNSSYEPSNNGRPNNNQSTHRQAADTRYNTSKPADRRTSRRNSQDPYNRRTPSMSETTPRPVNRRGSRQNKTSIHRRATTTTGERNNHNRSTSSVYNVRNNQDQPFDRRTSRNGSYEPSNNRRPSNNKNTHRQAEDTRYNKHKVTDRRASRKNSQNPSNRRAASNMSTHGRTTGRRKGIR